MTIFDRYIAVDWSAANTPRVDKDSIWIAERAAAGPLPSLNPSTRAAATDMLIDRLRDARGKGQRVLVGFDFNFGYPKGAARAISGKPGWSALWDAISAAITDDAENRSNRFEVASTFNRTLETEHFWGHPPHHRYADLRPTKPIHGYAILGEHRMAEAHVRGPQPVWKLSGIGSVGSQTLLGIPRLQQLRRAFPEAGIWPFETDFERHLRPITLAEIYPSMFPLTGTVLPRDREQVEIVVQRFADLDAAGRLVEYLSAPSTLLAEQRQTAIEEEGWIAGVGHEQLIRNLPPAARQQSFLRDPAAIAAQSLATIRAEADLSLLPGALHDVAIAMIEACGMVDIADDIRATATAPAAIRKALAAGAPILCDSEPVRASLTSGNTAILDASAPDRLAGAIVVIGSAPAALFRLLEMLDADAPRPAAIIATPAGFVGAVEAKAELALGRHAVPFVTLLGRRGGPALAAAALNALGVKP